MAGPQGDARKYDGFLPGQWPIDGYGAGGFQFGGMSHRGSILALPSGIRIWAASTPADITPETLAAVFAEEKGLIEHLLVGTGDALRPLSQPVRDALRAVGIRAEPMATGAAARTYNILVGERRRVAAALLAAA
jgi:uncharacterized protein